MSVLWFDGLLTQLDDAGVYFLPDDDVDELLEAAAINRFPCLRVDLRDCADKADLLRRLALALNFPAHFGNNWDALADALGDLRKPDSEGLVLLLENSERLRLHALAEFKTAMEVLQASSRDWARSKRPFWAFIALTDAEFNALA
ncbi:MAG TPA: barstar family protein [Arenimonas sp.]|uniref:barstar family protein n=1 Tax=Arenimonas sp. TaxID=1872635 RepID=UPI002BC329D8|nr:barstar family protein [Arenimonas sp.]HMB57720.1 barstar family protein [Arenimonas sp.]